VFKNECLRHISQSWRSHVSERPLSTNQNAQPAVWQDSFEIGEQMDVTCSRETDN
jgi:hypothetical protein